jgi:hypothetical protein
MGRPVAIQDYNVTAKPLERFENGVEDSSPNPDHLQNSFYLDSDISINARHTCEMFEIATEVLEKLYVVAVTQRNGRYGLTRW